jgi:hypothetical protein
MKKFLPIIIVAGIAVLGLGFVAWNYLGKGAVTLPVSAPVVVEKEAGEEGGEFVGKIKEVVARGVPMKCTYAQGDYSGTSYIKGEKMYGEVSQAGRGGYVIIKNNCMWTWNQGENQGIKMCYEEDFWEMSEEYAQEGQTSVPTEAEYRCVPAVISDSQFDPPASVNFLDMEQMMEGLGE